MVTAPICVLPATSSFVVRISRIIENVPHNALQRFLLNTSSTTTNLVGAGNVALRRRRHATRQHQLATLIVH
jgi:hypothetical protein